MNRIARLLRTVLLLAGLTSAWASQAAPSCHADPQRAAEQRALDEVQITALLSERPAAAVPDRLQRLLSALQARSPRLRHLPPVQLMGFEERELNAYAADHGVIILTSALWDPRHALSDDELAAVLAHELAHVEVRDGLAEACEMQLRVGDERTDIAQVRARLANLNPVSALGRNAAELLHEQERLADARGIALLHDAGHDPGAMLSVLAKLHGPQLPGAEFRGANTHPEWRERIAQARQQVHSVLGPPGLNPWPMP